MRRENERQRQPALRYRPPLRPAERIESGVRPAPSSSSPHRGLQQGTTKRRNTSETPKVTPIAKPNSPSGTCAGAPPRAAILQRPGNVIRTKTLARWRRIAVPASKQQPAAESARPGDACACQVRQVVEQPGTTKPRSPLQIPRAMPRSSTKNGALERPAMQQTQQLPDTPGGRLRSTYSSQRSQRHRTPIRSSTPETLARRRRSSPHYRGRERGQNRWSGWPSKRGSTNACSSGQKLETPNRASNGWPPLPWLGRPLPLSSRRCASGKRGRIAYKTGRKAG